MDKYKIKDISIVNPSFDKTKLHSDSIVSFVPMAAISDINYRIEHEEEGEISKYSKGYTSFEKGDLLLAKITPCFENGKIAIADISHPIGFGSTEFYVLRTDPTIVLTKYLYYLLRSNTFLTLGKQNMTGSAGQKRLRRDFLENFQISLPSLEDQNNIVSILDKVELLSKNRKQTIELLDDYLKSVFFEMFGDPNVNNKGWKCDTLKNCTEVFSDGPFGSNLKTEHYRDSGIRVIRLGNIGTNRFLDKTKLYISEEHYQTIKRHTCLPGDILIATLGDPNLRACIQPNNIPIAVNKADCLLCRVDKSKVLPEYLCYLLNLPSFLHMVSSLIHGQTRSRISSGQLKGISIPVPPIELQKDFLTIVEKTEILKQKMRIQYIELDTQFQSQMQMSYQAT